MNVNKVFISGNLTRDPEVRDVNGTELARFSVAVSRQWRDRDGEPQKEVSYIDCTAWGKTAATIGRYFSKGKPIFVEGRLRLEQWTGQDGTKRSKLGVVVESFQFVPDGGRGEARGAGAGGAHQAPPADDAPAPRRTYRDGGWHTDPAPAAARAPAAPAAPGDDIDGPPTGDDNPF